MNFASKLKPSFTLIEVLVVIAILGILSSSILIAINPNVRGAQARDAVRKQDLGVLYNALVAYLVDHGSLPNPGPDGAEGSSEDPWLEELKSDYLKNLPKDPRQAGIFGSIAGIFRGFGVPNDHLAKGGNVAAVTVPNKSKTYQMKVLVLNYMPTTGSNLNTSITGINSSVSAMRTHVNNIKNETLQALEDGSKYHKTGPVTMDYSIAAEREYLEALPVGLPLGGGVNRPDYMWILNRENICDWVNNQGVTEVWLFGYHHGNIAPAESNMAGPNGDISNSERTNDMPICSKTYVMYNYNYGRSSNEATHNHGHHIESVMAHIDQTTWDQFAGPWQNYSTSTGSPSAPHRCGWTHSPPNAGNPQYIYNSNHTVWTDCEDWRPNGIGNAISVNCTRWECDERKFHIWRWQGLPGKDNALVGVTNWWDFIGDFDAAIASGQKLVYDVTNPTTPTSLTATNIYSSQLTLNWTGSTDDFAVFGYQVKRDGVVIGTSATTSFVDYTVSANTQYSYTVAAVDTSQNVSGESDALSVTTTASSGPTYDRPVLDSTSYKVGGPSAKNYCFLHSIGSGQNRYLVTGIGMRTGITNSVVSVKFNGVNMTKIGSQGTALRTELWGMKSPPNGVGEICVSLANQPSGGGTIAGATSWNFVNQTTPLGAYAGAGASSTNPNIIVPSTVNSVVVDVGVLPSGGLVGTAVAGQTVVWNNWSYGDTTSMGSYKSGTPWITGMSWVTHYEAWSMSGVSLNLGLPPPPVIIVPDPSVVPSPTPSASSEPQAEVGCPESIGNYCYVASADLAGFTLWAWLENDDDPQIWNKPGATCALTPPKPEFYNFCMKY